MIKKWTTSLLIISLFISMFIGITSSRIIAAGETEPNLASGKTVTASSTLEASAGWGLTKVTDGIRGTGTRSFGWSSQYFTWTNHQEWMTVDLGSVTTIGRVDLYARELSPGIGLGFPEQFAIMVSVDGTTWMNVREVTGFVQPGMEAQRFSFQPVDARYVKIEGRSLSLAGSEYRMQFSEIEIYRSPMPDKPSNGIHEAGELKVHASSATGSPVKVSFYKRSLVPLADLSNGGSSGFDNKQAMIIPGGIAPGAGDTNYLPEAVSGMTESDDRYYTTRSPNMPYQRYDIHIEEDVNGLSELNVTWEGRTDQTATLYAWDYSVKKWTELSSRTGDGMSDFLLKGKLVTSRMVSTQTARLMVVLSQKNVTEPGKLPTDGEYDFSFVWMTDTQFYSQSYPHIYDRMSQWIADNQDDKRIKYVLHTGDLVEVWNKEDQWKNADRSMKILENADVPYGVVAGNHDVNHNVNDYTNYWRYFGRDRFEGKPWYGGDKDNNRHHYDLISAGGMDFVILYLGVYGSVDNETITWANNVLQQYKDRYAIVGTHAYIDPSGKYGVNGKDIMEKIVAPNENVFLTVSGHYHGAFYNVKRMNGRVVYEVLSDYQGGPEGGLGYMRLLQFDAETKRMYMNTYSPYMNDFNFFEDKLEQATFPLVQEKGEIALATDYIGIQKIQNEPVGTVESAPSGSIASIKIDNPGDQQDGWIATAAHSSGNEVMSDIFRFESDSDPDDRIPPNTSVQTMPLYQTPLYTHMPSEPAGPWTNYAKNQNVSASSDVGKWGWSRAGVVDGVRDSALSFGWTSYNDLKNNHTEWVTVDMGRVRDINIVDLYPRNDAGNVGTSFPIDFTIQLSADNENWSTVADKKNYPKPSAVQSFPFPVTAARFVKIEATNLRQDAFNNYHIQLAEIEIFGRDASAPTVPQPAGKPIWQGWFSPVVVTLTATDNKSGLARIQYSRDGGATWLPYTGSFLVSEEGIHRILYRSTDQAGNMEETKSLEVKIDHTPPVTTVQPSAANWTNQDVTVALSATDNLSGAEIQYSLDGGATWTYYSFPFVVTEEGVYEIQYRSMDYAGNVEPAKSLEVKIDKTRPELTVGLDKETLGPPNHKLETVTAAVYASDPLSGIASWSLTSITSNEPDNGSDDGNTENDIQNAESGTPDTVFELRAERSGTGSGRVYTIVYTATDHAGNSITVPAQVTVP